MATVSRKVGLTAKPINTPGDMGKGLCCFNMEGPSWVLLSSPDSLRKLMAFPLKLRLLPLGHPASPCPRISRSHFNHNPRAQESHLYAPRLTFKDTWPGTSTSLLVDICSKQGASFDLSVVDTHTARLAFRAQPSMDIEEGTPLRDGM